MSSSSHKKRRMNKSSGKSIFMVDRISDLPDSILCHILYSFPTKFVATTSVLSKRWRYMWLSVLALDFDSRDFKMSEIGRVMYSTMDRRDITLPIHSFRVKYHNSSCCNQEDVNRFVQHVMQRGIQNFDLNMSKECFKDHLLVALPVTILSCRTLKVLKLTNITVKSFSNPRGSCLPCLKTLHLERVYFERYEDLLYLLLGCPILEDLETINCDMSELEVRFMNFGIVLRNLIKARISEFDLALCAVSNAKILRVDDVEMFTCWTQILMFQSLTHLELNFFQLILCPRWTWLLELLKLCPKLQNLIIKDNKALDETNDECWKDPPHVPVCLRMQLKVCRIKNYKGKKYDLEFAEYIIENSKLLDIMTIKSARSLDTKKKHQLSKKLSSYTRGSTTCKLFFNGSLLRAKSALPSMM
ncbi:hypothetical protein P8452_36342 [Trifolium repens]|nr:hypothetical protein P8452_36342 [Trifolium repens]